MCLLTLIQVPCIMFYPMKFFKFEIGLKHFFNINLGIGIIKKLLFGLYFRHISQCFYLNFDRESSLDVELNSTSKEYPLGILLTGPTGPKTRNTWKKTWWWHSGVLKKYAVWVLVGCGIKFRIQRALPIEIWVKTQGDMLKIRTQKVVFSFLLQN